MEVISYIITNGIAVIFVFLSWISPRVGRILFSILFFLASCLNVYTASQNAEVYQYFAELTWSDIYRQFITGWFKDNTTWVVVLIGICQLFIAISMWLKGSVVRVGAVAAILFFVSISPFGFGSAFPATLIMALAMYFILKSADASHRATRMSNVPFQEDNTSEIVEKVTIILLISFLSACSWKESTDQANTNGEGNAIALLLDSACVAEYDLSNGSHIREFYKKNNYKTIWIDERTFKPAADSLFHLIQSAAYEGSIPEDYHLTTISSILEKPYSDISASTIDILFPINSLFLIQ